MNKKNLLSQLNIIHIAFSGVLILILLISSLLFNYWQIIKTSETNQLKNFENVTGIIAADFTSVIQLSKSLNNLDQLAEKELVIELLLSSYNLIGQINVIDKRTNTSLHFFNADDSALSFPTTMLPESGFAIICFNDSTIRTCYVDKSDRNTTTLIIFKTNWIKEYNAFIGANAISMLAFFDSKSGLTDDVTLNNTLVKKEIDQVIQYYPIQKDEEKSLFQKHSTTDGDFRIVVKSLVSAHCFIALINPGDQFEAFNSKQFFLYSLAGLILFLLSVFLINFINSHLISPFTEIVSSIKLNDRFKTDRLVDEKDYGVISKYIRNIENQLSFYEKKFEQITSEKKGLENDLKLASRLQKNLFPANTPLLSDHKKFEIYAYTDSAYDVGGDLYDCFLIDDDHLLIAIADVAGKGIAASLYMIYSHTLLRSLVKPGSSVTEIIDQLNNRLIEENISDMFVTIFLGILTLSDGEFEYCNAAHSLPCMITAKGCVFELSETHGIPVGIYPDRAYQSSKIVLDEGDQIFLYTDGLTDSVDENGLKYSMDVLKYNLMGAWFFTASEVVERIKKSVEYFRGNNKAVDDITLLSFKYSPGNQQVD